MVGVPHPRWDETPVAVLVSDGDERVTLEDVRGFLADRLARFKLPTDVRYVAKLPRTGSGKVDKTAIRASLLGEARPSERRDPAGAPR